MGSMPVVLTANRAGRPRKLGGASRLLRSGYRILRLGFAGLELQVSKEREPLPFLLQTRCGGSPPGNCSVLALGDRGRVAGVRKIGRMRAHAATTPRRAQAVGGWQLQQLPPRGRYARANASWVQSKVGQQSTQPGGLKSQGAAKIFDPFSFFLHNVHGIHIRVSEQALHCLFRSTRPLARSMIA
jgi:hypothetical protein